MISLGEFCDSVRDGTHDTPKPTHEGKYLVTSKAINNNSIDFNSCYYISKNDFTNINKRSLVEKWDVLMTMIGSVGRLLLVTDTPDFAIKNIALFKVGNEIKAKWLYYYLSMPSVQTYFEMIANGTSQHFISLGHLRKLQIANIPKNGSKIVSILSNYDTLIDINTKRINLLEKSARELYKEWFVRMRFPGYEQTKFVKGVPEGWKVGCLKDVSTLVSKKVKSEVIPIYVTTDNMLKDFQGIDYNELSEKPEGKVCEFEAGDILLSNIRPYFKKLWRANQRGGCSADVLVFRANKKINQHFLYYTMCTESFIDYVVAGSNGTKMPRGNKAFTMNFPIIIPDKGVMDLFHKNVASVYSIIETLQRQNLTLAATRDRLLPRLLSGNLEVKA